MPAVLSAIFSAIYSAFANKSLYRDTLYSVFPAMEPRLTNGTMAMESHHEPMPFGVRKLDLTENCGGIIIFFFPGLRTICRSTGRISTPWNRIHCGNRYCWRAHYWSLLAVSKCSAVGEGKVARRRRCVGGAGLNQLYLCNHMNVFIKLDVGVQINVVMYSCPN